MSVIPSTSLANSLIAAISLPPPAAGAVGAAAGAAAGVAAGACSLIFF